MDAVRDLIDALVDHQVRTAAMLDRAEGIELRMASGDDAAAVLVDEVDPLLVAQLTAAIEQLHLASARFRRAEARTLRDAGLSVEEIARRFGVTRQRVSTLLNTASPEGADFGSYRRAATA